MPTVGGEGVHPYARPGQRRWVATVYVCAGGNISGTWDRGRTAIKFVPDCARPSSVQHPQECLEIRRLVKKPDYRPTATEGKLPLPMHLAHLVPRMSWPHDVSTDGFLSPRHYGCRSYCCFFRLSLNLWRKAVGIPENKITVIPNGIDQKCIYAAPGRKSRRCVKYRLPEGCFTAAIARTLRCPEKSSVNCGAVKALPERPEKARGSLLRLAGLACYEEFVQTLRKYGISGNFGFTGWTSSRSILGVSDVLL